MAKRCRGCQENFLSSRMILIWTSDKFEFPLLTPKHILQWYIYFTKLFSSSTDISYLPYIKILTIACSIIFNRYSYSDIFRIIPILRIKACILKLKKLTIDTKSILSRLILNLTDIVLFKFDLALSTQNRCFRRKKKTFQAPKANWMSCKVINKSIINPFHQNYRFSHEYSPS